MKEKIEVLRNEISNFTAKNLSKVFMFLGSTWIFTASLLKGLGKLNMSIREIVGIGFSISFVWSPTYMSIWLDKIVNNPKQEIEPI